jgi:hypothetical protein
VSSTLPSLLDKLRTQLVARGGLAGVTVTTVPVGPEDTSREHITFTRADQTEHWDAMQRRGEEYTVEGMIIIQKPGAGNAAGKAAYDRAFALLEEVRSQLATDPTVNSAVLDCRLTSWSWRPSLTDPPGHVSVVEFTLTAQAHNI